MWSHLEILWLTNLHEFTLHVIIMYSVWASPCDDCLPFHLPGQKSRFDSGYGDGLFDDDDDAFERSPRTPRTPKSPSRWGLTPSFDFLFISSGFWAFSTNSLLVWFMLLIHTNCNLWFLFWMKLWAKLIVFPQNLIIKGIFIAYGWRLLLGVTGAFSRLSLGMLSVIYNIPRIINLRTSCLNIILQTL